MIDVKVVACWDRKKCTLLGFNSFISFLRILYFLNLRIQFISILEISQLSFDISSAFFVDMY